MISLIKNRLAFGHMPNRDILEDLDDDWVFIDVRSEDSKPAWFRGRALVFTHTPNEDVENDVPISWIVDLGKMLYNKYYLKGKSIYVFRSRGTNLEALVCFAVWALIKRQKDFDPIGFLHQQGKFHVLPEVVDKKRAKDVWDNASAFGQWFAFGFGKDNE